MVSNTSWICPIIEVDGELAFELPDELMEALNLDIGDTLQWIIRDDGTVILKKVQND